MTVLAVVAAGLTPVVVAAPAQASASVCSFTIEPAVGDDSLTLGQALDDSFVAANAEAAIGGCPEGVNVFLGTAPGNVEYQLPRSLNWTDDDTFAIIGISDDTPVLWAADDTRILTVEAGSRGAGPPTVDLTRLSLRGGNVSSGSGGALRGDDSTIFTLAEMEFIANQSADSNNESDGGAIQALDGTVRAISSKFMNNRADDDGGAIYALHVVVEGSDFIGNRTTRIGQGYGGAVENFALGSLSVGPDSRGRPTRFVDNESNMGGAIYVWAPGSTAEIEAEFVSNEAFEAGGAIYVDTDQPGTTQLISNSTFLDDSAPSGGAISFVVNNLPSAAASGTILNSTFTGSRASGRGGAIFSDFTLNLDGVSVSDAVADEGGAVFSGGPLTIQNSYLSGNGARLGGAVATGDDTGGELTVVNSTLWGNSADDSGSAVFVGADTSLTLSSIVGSTIDDSVASGTSLVAAIPGSSIRLTGTILSKDGSATSPCEGTIDDSGGNLATSDCDGITGSDLSPGLSAVVSDDSLALLEPAMNSTLPSNTGAVPTMAFGPTSVAINRFSTDCPSTDGRGVARPQGSACDAGAYEAGAIESVTTTGSTSGTVGAAYSGSFSATGFGSGFFAWDDSGTTLPPGLVLDSAGTLTGTPTQAGSFTFTARVLGPVDDSFIARTLTVNPAVDPTPSPSSAPSAPREVSAMAGVESVVVSWLDPASSGSFPVTTYQVTATPSGHGCLVSAPTLTCTVTGLAAGTSYTFVVKALNGAGWSSPSAASNAVVPEGQPAAKAILITSSRDRVSPSIVRVDGTTTGLVGAEVTPYVRKPGQTGFTPGSNVRTVDADGRFTWQRKSGKKLYVYFTSGDVRSNRLIIGPS